MFIYLFITSFLISEVIRYFPQKALFLLIRERQCRSLHSTKPRENRSGFKRISSSTDLSKNYPRSSIALEDIDLDVLKINRNFEFSY